MTSTSRLATLLLPLLLATGACGDDDGAGVTEIGDGGGSASASASGSASAPASGSGSASAPASGSGSASGSAVGDECHVEGGVEAEEDSVVAVALDEWTVTAEPREATGPVVELKAANTGEVPHEVVVVQGSSAEELPVTDGHVDEEALAEGALIGEIEAFAPGGECEGYFELPAGDYVLFCNVVDTAADGTTRSHFSQGMHTVLTVS